jgi:pseudaminic acid biosynthesis-associated methylase
MPTGPERQSDAERLEALWGGVFGDAYGDRNAAAGAGHEPFWRTLLGTYPVNDVCEVGCNVGANLRWIAEILQPPFVHGVDVNRKALREVHARLPGVDAVWSRARKLPFPDSRFELVFTTGVLIHQPDDSLAAVMAEIVRTSSRYVLCGEYFADPPMEVPYRGQQGALFKRDYGRLYQEMFPELRLLEHGFLARDEGWDDLDWWIFAKSSGVAKH